MELGVFICMPSPEEENGRGMGVANVKTHFDLQTAMRHTVSQRLGARAPLEK